MSYNEINKIINRVSNSLKIILNVEIELSQIMHYYNDLRQSAIKSFQESRNLSISKKENEIKKIKSDSKKLKEVLLERINILNESEKLLKNKDTHYVKHIEFDYSAPLNASQLNTKTLDQNISRFNELYNLESRIIRDTLMSVKSSPIQLIEMAFSNKRKDAYDLINLTLKELKVIVSIIEDKYNELEKSQLTQCDETYENAIDSIALETAKLIDDINGSEENKRNKVLANAKNKVESLISKEEVSLLNEMSSLLGSNNILPQNFTEQVLIGEYSVDLGLIEDFSNKYSDFFDVFSKISDKSKLNLPALFDISENLNLCFFGRGDNDSCKEAVHSLMFSLIKNQPANKQIFFLSDPESRSKGFDKYLEFLKKFPDIFGGKINTTRELLKNTLNDLSRFVDNIGQTKFVGYRNIFEYNLEVTEKQESLKCICLLNFPLNFDEEMLNDLYNIVRNGKSYGVHVIIGFDDKYVEHINSDNQIKLISNIIQECIPFERQSLKWVNRDGVELLLFKAPDQLDLENFIDQYTTEYSKNTTKVLHFSKILDSKKIFSCNSSEELQLPLGINEEGEIQNLIFGKGTIHHALIVGSLGSGKSTLLHTIIMSSLYNYSPDELHLYLLDFKEGVEFEIYAGFSIPHIKVIALDAQQEFGQSILDNLWEEMIRRSDLFKEFTSSGSEVKDIEIYRKLSGKKLPRILVVIDEFQELVNESYNRKVANYCGDKLEAFIAKSRSYGIHFILATQTLSRLNSGFAIKKSTINEMYSRIGLKCTENECALVFGDKFGKAAFEKLGVDKGDATFSSDYVRKTPVSMKVAYYNNEDQKGLLSRIQEHFSIVEMKDKTRLFIGNQNPNIIDCQEFKTSSNKISKVVPILIGESIKIAPTVRISLDKIKRNNLLIVGSNQEMIDRIVSVIMLNVLTVNIPVVLFDGLTILRENTNPNISNLNLFYKDIIKVAESNNQVIKFIDDLYSEFLLRKKMRGALTIDSTKMVTIIINNIQWIESINAMLQNKSVDDFLEDIDEVERFKYEKDNNNNANFVISKMDNFINELKSSTKKTATTNFNQKLNILIDTGYMYGFNFIISAHDYISIRDHLYNTFTKFNHRIIFSLNSDDSNRIIPDSFNIKQSNNSVIYYDGINPSYQIKPFIGVSEYINTIKGGLQNDKNRR